MKRILIMVTFVAAGRLHAQTQPPQTDLKVVVPGVHAYKNVPEGTAEVLSDLLLGSLHSRHGIRALGPSDTRALLTAEQQKNLLGCTDESCMAELAGALGADWLIAGSLGKLEDLYVLTLQLIDAKEARVTARVNTTLTGLKQAPDKLGPLVDQLLGQQPRPRPPAAALAKPPEPLKKKVMSEHAFQKKLEAYLKAIIEARPDSPLVEMRREILEDLVLTPFQRTFSVKRGYLWRDYPHALTKVTNKFRAAKHDLHARQLKRFVYELYALRNQAQILADEYERGLEMEKAGTGRRLMALPFEVKEVVIPALDDLPVIRTYRKVFDEAQDTLDQALQAARANDLEAFESLFTPEEPDLHRTRPDQAFHEIRTLMKNGYRVSICPFGILKEEEIEYSAKSYEKRGLVDGCWRRSNEQVTGLDTVKLKLHEGKWRILRW